LERKLTAIPCADALTPREQALLTRARPVNPEAYDAYLRGQYLLNDPTPQNLKKALADFGHAIDLDPHFALEFRGMSLVYVWAAWGALADSSLPITASSKAKAAAEKALQLDNNLAEAHCALGTTLENFFDWAGAESVTKASGRAEAEATSYLRFTPIDF
jgi:tetratricopeptide (TPR) repeat protein